MKLNHAIDAFLSQKLTHRRILPSSADLYRWHLERVAGLLGAERELDEAAGDVEVALEVISGQYADSAFAQSFQLTKAVYDWARARGAATSDPFLELEAPIVHDEKPKVFISEQQVEQLLESVRIAKRMHWRRDFALVASLYYPLLRVSEARLLEIPQLNFDRLEIALLGKGRRARYLPIGLRYEQILLEYLPHVPAGQQLLFASQARGWETTGVLDNCRVEELLGDYARAAALPHITPHVLRRSAADALRRKGWDLAVIQKLLGHRSLTTTQKYLGVSSQELRRAANSL